MDFKVEAARLTEKVYTLKGTNQANELQSELEKVLLSTYNQGRDDLNDFLHGVKEDPYAV